MLLLAADENFNNDILRGLLRRDPSRVLITHDRNTITKFAYERVVAGKPMPGVIEVDRPVPMSVAIDDIFLLATTSDSGDWQGQIIYLPLR